jgi:hypothetical protein
VGDPTEKESKTIADADRLEQFLKDPVVEQAVLNLHASYFEGFKSSKSADEQNLFGWKGRALDDLLLELKKVVHAGVVAKIDVSRRQPAPKQKR